MKYRSEIDGLRGLAVVPVLFFHAGFESFSGGFVGVDVFFVISGYLITTIVADDLRNGTFTFRGFYERRARRILPALLTVCLATLPAAFCWMSPLEFRDFSESLVAVSVFASNIFFHSEASYFAPAVELKPLLHTWSLAVEEQFYVLFPMLLVLLRRSSASTRLATITCISILSFAIALRGSTTDPSAAFYLSPARAWELGVGALLAMTQPASEAPRRLTTVAATTGGLALIIFAISSYDRSTPFPSYFALAPVLGTALLIRYSGENDWVGRLLRLPPVVTTGLLSYSLYLWHQPILAFQRIRNLYEPGPTQMVAGLGLAVVLGMLTWKFIETPFRDRNSISSGRVALSTIGLSLLMMTLGFAGHLTDGFKDANARRATAAALEYRLRTNFGLSRACKQTFTLSSECSTSDVPEVVIWGDSFAMHLVDALVASKPDVRLIQFTKSGCGPVVNLAPLDARWPQDSTRGCLEFNTQVMNWIQRRDSVKYVILSSDVLRYVDQVELFYTDHTIVRPDRALAIDAFVSTITRLKERGIVPILVSPPPRFGGDIGRCIFKSRYLDHPEDSCNFLRSAYERHSARATSFLRDLENYCAVIWLDEYMCQDDVCIAATEETLYYIDDGHLTHEGSAAVGRSMRFYEQLQHLAR